MKLVLVRDMWQIDQSVRGATDLRVKSLPALASARNDPCESEIRRLSVCWREKILFSGVQGNKGG